MGHPGFLWLEQATALPILPSAKLDRWRERCEERDEDQTEDDQ